MTKVVNVKDPGVSEALRSGDIRYVYIDWPNYTYGLRRSPFATPFRAGITHSRTAAVRAYRHWIQKRPKLIELARRQLTGKILVCWCAPEPCHGDVLAKICDKDSKGIGRD